jgi:hypothetical protein
MAVTTIRDLVARAASDNAVSKQELLDLVRDSPSATWGRIDVLQSQSPGDISLNEGLKSLQPLADAEAQGFLNDLKTLIGFDLPDDYRDGPALIPDASHVAGDGVVGKQELIEYLGEMLGTYPQISAGESEFLNAVRASGAVIEPDAETLISDFEYITSKL